MTTHDPSMMEVADCVYTLEDGEVAMSNGQDDNRPADGMVDNLITT